MPTYCGIGGIARQLKEWPVGIGGVVHQQKEVWAGVGGVSKKIFSSKKTYTVSISGLGYQQYGAFAKVTVNGTDYYSEGEVTVEEGTIIRVTAGTVDTQKSPLIYVDNVRVFGSGSNSNYYYDYSVTSNTKVELSIYMYSTPYFAWVGMANINTSV